MIGRKVENFNPLGYDKYLVMFSGGKDSIACFLHLLELGVPKDKIELWHHTVDGQESELLFDWPVTHDYVRKFGQAFQVPVYFSWREGGIEREMNRNNTPTAAVWYETPTGLEISGGKSDKLGTRLQFPQTSASLSVRWCSAYAKIDVGRVAITKQERFKGKRTLVLTGERRQESAARSKYEELLPHQTDCQSRYVDHWRAVIDWSETKVWDTMQKWSVNPHPAYRLGWGRCSCMLCIFSSNDQLASAYVVMPEMVKRIADYEKQFGKTIVYKSKAGQVVQIPVMERVAKGKPFNMKQEDIEQGRSHVYYQPIILAPGQWELPLGAFGDNAGPS